MVEFSEEAGYPVGIHSPNKYFMVQMHYDNPKQTSSKNKYFLFLFKIICLLFKRSS
jgi:hypothetical protein